MPIITIAGKDVSFNCADDDTILRAALRSGIGLIYDCNVGACGFCKFELVEGQVKHLRENPPGWHERDQIQNRYLGCQAQPLSDCKIKVPIRDDYRPKIGPQKTSARLIKIEPVTHDISEFRFELETPQPFLPGQYALITVPGASQPRAYSIANAFSDREWHFQIRRVSGGEVTRVLFDELSVGGVVVIDGPYGMAYLRDDILRDVICIAGGSGIAPMLSIARAFSAAGTLHGQRLHFFYGARTPRDICGEKELASLPQYGDRIRYHAAVAEYDNGTSEVWPGYRGTVGELVEAMIGDSLKNHEVYFAGPPAMADAILKMATSRRVPIRQMHYDRFY